MRSWALIWSKIGGGALESLLYFAVRAAWEFHEALYIGSVSQEAYYAAACVTEA